MPVSRVNTPLAKICWADPACNIKHLLPFVTSESLPPEPVHSPTPSRFFPPPSFFFDAWSINSLLEKNLLDERLERCHKPLRAPLISCSVSFSDLTTKNGGFENLTQIIPPILNPTTVVLDFSSFHDVDKLYGELTLTPISDKWFFDSTTTVIASKKPSSSELFPPNTHCDLGYNGAMDEPDQLFAFFSTAFSTILPSFSLDTVNAPLEVQIKIAEDAIAFLLRLDSSGSAVIEPCPIDDDTYISTIHMKMMTIPHS
ncbi:hypothetical protein H0H92_006995 [Tricholoma furcatifolium]|nr:hypothetical protein H0H92_006995 [Tricholoma furcatifolium]